MKAFAGQLAILLPGSGVFIPSSDFWPQRPFVTKPSWHSFLFFFFWQRPFILGLGSLGLCFCSQNSVWRCFAGAQSSWRSARFGKCHNVCQGISWRCREISRSWESILVYSALSKFFGAAHLEIRSTSWRGKLIRCLWQCCWITIWIWQSSEFGTRILGICGMLYAARTLSRDKWIVLYISLCARSARALYKLHEVRRVFWPRPG